MVIRVTEVNIGDLLRLKINGRQYSYYEVVSIYVLNDFVTFHLLGLYGRDIASFHYSNFVNCYREGFIYE